MNEHSGLDIRQLHTNTLLDSLLKLSDFSFFAERNLESFISTAIRNHRFGPI